MKFNIGSDADTAHCIALKHEFLRCEDAFQDFEKFGTAMIMAVQEAEQAGLPAAVNDSRRLAFKTYNSYARFVHHLYEFLLGALARERGDTAQIRAEDADRWIQANAQRVLTGRRSSILNGTAPSWKNHISAFPETVPTEFAAEFRAIRNKANGHVTHERASKSLTDFYDNYHKFLHMSYWNWLGFWGSHRNVEFPDLQEITDFSIMIREASSATTAPVNEDAAQQRGKAIMDDIWKLT
jgi:hypothetical protein